MIERDVPLNCASAWAKKSIQRQNLTGKDVRNKINGLWTHSSAIQLVSGLFDLLSYGTVYTLWVGSISLSYSPPLLIQVRENKICQENQGWSPWAKPTHSCYLEMKITTEPLNSSRIIPSPLNFFSQDHNCMTYALNDHWTLWALLFFPLSILILTFTFIDIFSLDFLSFRIRHASWCIRMFV